MFQLLRTARAKKTSRRGLQYLDREHPGWENRIPADVDISSGEHCVVVHLTGKHYNEGITILGISNPAYLGFCVYGSPGDQAAIAEYSVLTSEFRAGRDDRLKLKKQQTLLASELDRQDVENLVEV
ncbi:MAG TPA: hypothetical protein VJH67_00970 [Candidatus Paceibacterota bacterium]